MPRSTGRRRWPPSGGRSRRPAWTRLALPRWPSPARGRRSLPSTRTAGRWGPPSSGWTTGPSPRLTSWASDSATRWSTTGPASHRSRRRGPRASCCGGDSTSPSCSPRARHFLLVEDFILHRLSGRYVTEGGVQSTSLLFDIRDRGWWEPMLDAVGVGPARLPELVRPGAIVGHPVGRGRAGPWPAGRRSRRRRGHGPGRRGRRGRQHRQRRRLGEHGWRADAPGLRRSPRWRPDRPDARLRPFRPGSLPLLPGLPDRRDGPDLVPRPVRRGGGGPGRRR